MKYKLKLLKNWTNPSDNTEFKAGDIVELESKQLYATMLVDEIGEKYVEADEGTKQAKLTEDIKSIVADAVKEAQKGFEIPELAKKSIHIEIKDKSDEDPACGYLPQTIKKPTRDQKLWGFGNFAKDVYTACDPSTPKVSEKLQKNRERMAAITEKAAGDGLLVGTDTAGGFLIPPEFSLMMMDSSLETAVVRPRASSMQIGSDSIKMPQVQNYDHSSNLVYGGLLAYFKGETDQLAESKPKMEELELNLNELTILAFASHKMLRFSPIAVGSFLLPMMGEAMAWKEDDTFINGTGAGMPLGLLNAPGEISIAIETGQTLAGSAVVTANVLKMFQRLLSKRPSSIAWLYNKVDLFYWLSTLTLDVGTAGAPAGLVQSIVGQPAMSMLGIPLVDTEHCQAAGTVGDIILSDLSQYIIADDRGGPEVAQSMHLKFDYGQMAFRIIKYVDAQPRWSKAFTRQSSTNTSSPIVSLAARS